MQAALVYPHQLFRGHPALGPGRLVYLVEDPLFFGNDPHWPAAMHKQKLLLHRASMRAYAAELESAGWEVEVLALPDGSETDSAQLLERHLPRVTEIHLADPADDILMRRIRRFADRRGATLHVHESPNFLSPAGFLERHIARRKRPFMASFYEAQRKRMGILLEKDGSPAGGRWSFDTENRRKLPKNHVPPPEPRTMPNRFVRDAAAWVERRFPENPGSVRHFRWPVTREDAAAWFGRFLDERLHYFGDYEDAVSIRHETLYHSAITPALNIGLLDPRDMVERVLARDVPVNSKEGFVRQVIGWREFMRGIYQHRGVRIRNGNFWNFSRPMPASFYDGGTGIPPIDRVIRRLLDDGWCHHIERLMLLGNFMLLCRIRPDDVYRWFMEMFVDSHDWVMVPNVYGMSQFADGGGFTTKPYLSGSSYVRRMSDEPAGDWCGVWDGLYWSFIADHSGYFACNPRLSMMVRTWERMPAAKQQAHRDAARDFLESL